MSYILLEYACRQCGSRQESLQSRSAPAKSLPHPPCGCAARADRALSAPKVKTVWCEAVSMGKSDPKPSPGCLDTRSIADGESPHEWRKRQNAYRHEQRRKMIKADLG